MTRIVRKGWRIFAQFASFDAMNSDVDVALPALVCAPTRLEMGGIVIGNWSILLCDKELEALGQERSQFVTVGRDVVQDILDCTAKLHKGR